jgi:hypothetical protein
VLVMLLHLIRGPCDLAVLVMLLNLISGLVTWRCW